MKGIRLKIWFAEDFLETKHLSKMYYKCKNTYVSVHNIYLKIVQMVTKVHLLIILFIAAASCSNIRNLGQSTDTCTKYSYYDKDGKECDYHCDGCKKVCIECESSFYLDSWSKCVKLPKNCLTVDKNGTCTKCKSKYFLNKNS